MTLTLMALNTTLLITVLRIDIVIYSRGAIILLTMTLHNGTPY
jgi:hypothetical protein